MEAERYDPKDAKTAKARRTGWTAAAAGVALAVFGLGFVTGRATQGHLAVASHDTFKVAPGKAIAATVNSLKAENKLVVYRFSGDARVRSTGVYGGFLHADQELIVPASVVYFIDMAEFGPEDVRYDEAAQSVEIALPPLKLGDIAFRPEGATQINAGLPTLSDQVVQTLAKNNYAAARTAFTQQAQGPQLVGLAREQAARSIATQFEIPLRAIGRTDIKVRAYFR